VDLGDALVARSQAAEVVQVREAALDHPALAPEARAVICAPAGDPVGDPPGPQDAPVFVVVIAPVGHDEVRLSARPADPPGDRTGGKVIQERHQLGDVVAVAAGERDRQRDSRGIDQEMVLGACAGAIDRGWPAQEPPKRARMWLASTTARDQSIAPAALSLTRSLWCRASQTPACCQVRSRRQQVTPEP